MSLEVLRAVIYYSRAKGTAYAVAIGLADHYNDERNAAWPSVERLATFARASERSTQYALRELCKPANEGGLGEWAAVPGAGPKKVTLYRPLFKNFGPRIVPSPRGADSAPLHDKGGANFVAENGDGGADSAAKGAESAPNPVKNQNPVRAQNAQEKGTGEPATEEQLEELRKLRKELQRGKA